MLNIFYSISFSKKAVSAEKTMKTVLGRIWQFFGERRRLVSKIYITFFYHKWGIEYFIIYLFFPSIIHSWIRNIDQNNAGLNGAWLKAFWSRISSMKKSLCTVITLFSFHADWRDYVDFCKIVNIFSISFFFLVLIKSLSSTAQIRMEYEGRKMAKKLG